MFLYIFIIIFILIIIIFPYNNNYINFLIELIFLFVLEM